MKANRRNFIKGVGGLLSFPLLESISLGGEPQSLKNSPPMRFLVVGNPYGMHPDNFFPKQFGKKFVLPATLSSLGWMQERMTIFSHTDHAMQIGHGRELAFLNGILPDQAAGFPEKNVSLDQVMAQHCREEVRYASVHATLTEGIRMSWTADGNPLDPFTDEQKLFDHLFVNLTTEEKRCSRERINRNESILDAVRGPLASLEKNVNQADRSRLDQFSSSVRELERSFEERKKWVGVDKPTFGISQNDKSQELTIHERYKSIFDMITYAFQTDLTRVATVAFPKVINYTNIPGVTRNYHGTTHNGKNPAIVAEELAIEAFQITQLSQCLKKLDTIKEPNSGGSLLDHTIVLFGSGMGYGGTHSCRDLPIIVAGGGFKHLGHVDTRNTSGNNMPLCNLYLTLLRRFGIEKDKFNTSTGSFELSHV